MDRKAKMLNVRIDMCFPKRDGTYKIMVGASNRSYEFHLCESKKAFLAKYAQLETVVGAVIRIIVSDDYRVIGFGDPVFDRFILTSSQFNATEMPEESFFRSLTEEEVAKLTS